MLNVAREEATSVNMISGYKESQRKLGFFFSIHYLMRKIDLIIAFLIDPKSEK